MASRTLTLLSGGKNLPTQMSLLQSETHIFLHTNFESQPYMNCRLQHGLRRAAVKGLPDVPDSSDQGTSIERALRVALPDVQCADILPGQCDEGKPTCKQCAKSKRECGGYRSEFEIVHRDQTRSTVRRMRQAHDVQQSSPITSPTIVFVHEYPHLPTHRSTPPRQEPHQRHPDHTPSPPPILTLSVAQRAACYFASNFILVPRDFTPHGYMDYLVPLIESARPGSALSYAFNACAFAALGNRVRADNVDFSSLALKQHTLALTRTHVALGDPKTANTDATLAAVLLLSMYEVRGPLTLLLPPDVDPLWLRASRQSCPHVCLPGAAILTAPSTSSRPGGVHGCVARRLEPIFFMACGSNW